LLEPSDALAERRHFLPHAPLYLAKRDLERADPGFQLDQIARGRLAAAPARCGR
jgi:hypothetical protein